MERNKIRKIRVSSKRQLTIPIDIYNSLGIDEIVECYVNAAGELVIRPDRSGYFDEEILRDLIRQGFEGEELIQKFMEIKGKIRPAIKAMIADADELVQKFDGVDKTEQLLGFHNEHN